MHAAEMQEKISAVKLFLFPSYCSIAKICFGQCSSAASIFLGTDMFYVAMGYWLIHQWFASCGAFDIGTTVELCTNLLWVPKIKLYFTV